MKDLLNPTLQTVEVAVPLPVEGIFSYALPIELEPRIKTGVRVRVPFKNRELIGYVVGITEEVGARHAAPLRLKAILEILDDEPVLSDSILQMTRWISRYYGSSWGEAIENALPKWVKYGKKAEKALKREKKGAAANAAAIKDVELTAEQETALQAIRQGFAEKNPKPILLYGITGSGKSEIYIRAIRETLAAGRTAICLVPEIALTEQLRLFFAHHFGAELEILHSKLSDGERFLAWKRIENGRRSFVLGPRSAVFAPLPNLGLIVIDEEHEGSYKQDTTPRYHAREVAFWRGRAENAVVVLGSATPSLESMEAASRGNIRRIDLTHRIDHRPLPQVTLLDLKDAAANARKLVILTPKMTSEIEINLRKKEGTMLLLNRRGFSTYIHCPKCSHVESCASCQVSLTYHQEDDTLLCHYCNLKKKVPSECSQCRAPLLRFAGFGTEKVESEIAARFPTARISRMDADSVRKKGSHEIILKDFRERKIDILIGTQMIAKGFDFPHVTLVGVILADVGLSLPDFRSGERTFQLLTQVAGRAGRGQLPGRVLIQTFSPNHASVRFAKDHDYLNFYRYETEVRKQYRYPPYCQLINLIVRARDEKIAYVYARAVRDRLKQALPAELELTGPAPLPFYRLRGHFRWHVMIKAPVASETAVLIQQALSGLKKPAGAAMALDVDPLNIL